MNLLIFHYQFILTVIIDERACLQFDQLNLLNGGGRETAGKETKEGAFRTEIETTSEVWREDNFDERVTD